MHVIILPGVIEPITVAIAIDLMRKEEGIKQKVTVSHGAEKVSSNVRKNELPCVHPLRDWL